MTEILYALAEISALLVAANQPLYKRPLFSKIDLKQRLIGIVGPRGVGKTTLIFQMLRERASFKRDEILYISADSSLMQSGILFDLARTFHVNHAGKLLCVDEAHRYQGWARDLKNIYDSFPKLQLIFSGSSSLNLAEGKADLSRRAALYHLPGLSFREYLGLFHGRIVPTITLDSLLKDHIKIAASLEEFDDTLKLFAQYLKRFYFPFAKEVNDIELFYQQLSATVDKTIYEDIASTFNLKTENLATFHQLLGFIATIPPGEINVHKLARSTKKNDDTIANYLEIMERASLLRFLGSSATGHALIKNTKKVYLENTNLYFSLNYLLGRKPEAGTIRELFLLNQLQNCGLRPRYIADGDMQVGESVFEVGGRNKGFSQFKGKAGYVVSDDIIIGTGNRIPLYLFGLLY